MILCKAQYAWQSIYNCKRQIPACRADALDKKLGILFSISHVTNSLNLPTFLFFKGDMKMTQEIINYVLQSMFNHLDNAPMLK